ncbi:MAG: TonB-dependent receptor [Candidatus Marinimicrobia bacterium]|nr:TonB-dependent receptor [Candidatus Neomarinimicrobiota bacterium]
MVSRKVQYLHGLMFLLIGCLSIAANAGVTGKITGIVCDKHNGEPLIGANILVEGQMFGAASDADGRYFILSVPPGTYTLNVSMIGYGRVTVRNVKVNIDHTTTVNVDLESQAIDMGREVIVTAKRPVIQKDVTNSTQFVELEELTQLPVSGAKEGLMIQTGIFLDPLPVTVGPNSSGRGEPRYSVRGGDQGEVKWFIDGVRVSSLIEGRADRGGSFTNVNLHAIEEVQLITSGFNAEYGEAQSGIVNVVTKEGCDRFSLSFEYEYGLPDQHHFGNYIYSRPTESQVREHLDDLYREQAAWEAAYDGNLPDMGDPKTLAHMEYMTNLDNEWWAAYQKEFRDHTNIPQDMWWNEYTYLYYDSTTAIGQIDPDWLTPYRKSNMYDYRKIPDQNFYLSMGGPLFTSRNVRGTFFLASQVKKEAYILPRPRDTHDLTNLTYNFAFQIKSNMKLRLTGFYNFEGHSTLQEYGLFANQAKYYRGWGSLLDTKTTSTSLLWNHVISNRMNYDLKLSYYYVDIKEYPSKYMVLGQSSNPDLWGWQRYDTLSYDIFVEPFDAWSFIYDEHWQTGDLSLVGSWNWQWNSYNFLKTGFEFRYNRVAELKAYRFPSFADWKKEQYLYMNRGLHETYNPVQFALYIQNKMEFESMILNLGLRYDYFNPNYEWFASNTISNYAMNPDYDAALEPDGNQVDSLGNVKYSFDNILDKPREKAPVYHMLSPRLGVSFPVTENTLLHFTYGHFYQMPPMDRMFELNFLRSLYLLKAIKNEVGAAEAEGREPAHIPSTSGDPERVVFLTAEPLKPERTTSFEVGIKQNFGDFAVLDVTAFYKDAFDKTDARAQLFDRRIYGVDPFTGTTTENGFYVSVFPGDYGDARGFETTLRTLFSKVFTLDINYSFSKSTIGRASPAVIKIDENGNYTYIWDTDVNKRIPVQNTYSRPHTVRTNIYLKYPETLQIPVITSILNGVSASILYQYISGQAFTYLAPDDPPDTYDNYRLPAYQTVDMRIEKTFNVGRDHSLSAYMRVTNLLNRKNLISLGEYYYNDPNTVYEEYVKNGAVPKVDEYGYDISWQNYAQARRIYFGVKYNFR